MAGVARGVTDAAQSISFKAMVEGQHVVGDIVGRDPDVVSVASFVGAGTVNATINTGPFGETIANDVRPHQRQAAQS